MRGNLIFIHLAVSFFQTCHLLFLRLLKPAILALGKMKQEDFQELELSSEFVARLSQVSSPSPFTSIPKDLYDVFCLFLPCRLSGDAMLNKYPLTLLTCHNVSPGTGRESSVLFLPSGKGRIHMYLSLTPEPHACREEKQSARL